MHALLHKAIIGQTPQIALSLITRAISRFLQVQILNARDKLFATLADEGIKIS